MSTTTVERISSNSLRLSNPDLPGGEIEVRDGDARGAVSIALEFLRGLGSQAAPTNGAVSLPAPIPTKIPVNGRKHRRGRSKPRPWSPEDVALLGTNTDAIIAKQLKRTPGAVTAQRKVRHVTPFGGARRGRKPAAEAAKS